MPNEIFSTSDISLAATLITLKFPMVGIDHQLEGTKGRPVGYFKFEQNENLENAKLKYLQSMLSVEPKSLLSNLRSLKSEVENIWKNPNSKF